MDLAPKPRMSHAEFVAFERGSEERHEFLRGEIWAMSGGTIEHGRLAANIIHELRRGLGAAPCVVLTSNVRVWIEATDRSTYPDVSVVCGPVATATEDPDAIVNPVLIVEVLSPSTEARDRGEKFAHYRRLPSLRHYLLVNQGEARLELYTLDGGSWRYEDASAGGALHLSAVGGGLALSVDAVYGNASAP